MAEATIEAYIAACTPEVGAVLGQLRALVKDVLTGGQERMKYGAPVYWNAAGEEVVYLYGGKDHANLGFLHGAELDDPQKVLEGTGLSGRHVKIFPGREPEQAVLVALLAQCAC